MANSKEARTIVVSGLEVKAGLTDIATFVERIGQVRVRHCKLLTDPITRCSQGVAYVELTNMADVQRALAALDGQEFRYPRGLMAGAVAVKMLLEPSEEAPLHISGLWTDISEAEIRALFEPFGMIDSVAQKGKKKKKKKKGSDDDSDDDSEEEQGFVDGLLAKYSKTAVLMYHKKAEAEMAASMMQDFEVAGNRIKVSLSAAASALPAAAEPTVIAAAPVMNLNGNNNGIITGATALVATGTAPPPPPPPPAAVVVAESAATHTGPVAPVGSPSHCIILRNLFDPSTEEGDTWAGEIQEDIEDECKKFGAVQQCIVDQHSEGDAYVKFDTAASAQPAANSLHGRWFSCKTIEVTYLTDDEFDAAVATVQAKTR